MRRDIAHILMLRVVGGTLGLQLVAITDPKHPYAAIVR